jgi:hypothetical protein
MIDKHGQPSSEAFQSIVGKEKPGRYIALPRKNHNTDSLEKK